MVNFSQYQNDKMIPIGQSCVSCQENGINIPRPFSLAVDIVDVSVVVVEKILLLTLCGGSIYIREHLLKKTKLFILGKHQGKTSLLCDNHVILCKQMFCYTMRTNQMLLYKVFETLARLR